MARNGSLSYLFGIVADAFELHAALYSFLMHINFPVQIIQCFVVPRLPISRKSYSLCTRLRSHTTSVSHCLGRSAHAQFCILAFQGDHLAARHPTEPLVDWSSHERGFNVRLEIISISLVQTPTDQQTRCVTVSVLRKCSQRFQVLERGC